MNRKKIARLFVGISLVESIRRAFYLTLGITLALTFDSSFSEAATFYESRSESQTQILAESPTNDQPESHMQDRSKNQKNPLTENRAKNPSSRGTQERSLGRGADPWIVFYEGRYYWIRSDNRNFQIIISVSDSLFPDAQNESQRKNGETNSPNESPSTVDSKSLKPFEPEKGYRPPEGSTLDVGYPLKFGKSFVIWKAPAQGAYSKEIWAPELWRIDGRWFVYFAASDGNNANHRAFVLVSKGENGSPIDEYELRGPLYTGDDIEGKTENRWAIDMTIFEHRDRRYAVWSGWEDDRDVQFLYIAPTSDPTTISGARVKICDNDEYLWQRVEENEASRGLMEGPEFLTRNGRIFLTYSTAASWLPTYKVGLLELVGDDPLDPSSWKKYPEPFFQSDELRFGVGHGCFIENSDDRSLWFVFHAKRSRTPGWLRDVFALPLEFDGNDFPRLAFPEKADF